MPDKVTISAQLSKDTDLYRAFEEHSDGFESRSEAVRAAIRGGLLDEDRDRGARVRALAQDEGMGPNEFLDQLEAGYFEDDRTFVEKIADQEFRAALASILSLLWNILVFGTVLQAGPSTTVTAFGAAGFVGIVGFLSLALVTSVAVLWLAVLAALAVVWVRDRRSADAAEEAV